MAQLASVKKCHIKPSKRSVCVGLDSEFKSFYRGVVAQLASA